MISVDSLCFSYTARPFIEDMSFSVKDGEISAFGALRSREKHAAENPDRPADEFPRPRDRERTEIGRHGGGFYNRIGVDFEFPSLYEKLTARENLRFFGSLYQKQRDLTRCYSASACSSTRTRGWPVSQRA